MRLQKYLAAAGMASRRKCEDYIVQGRVKVNGQTVKQLGTKVEEGDTVYVDDKRVEIKTDKVYYLLHKPVGYITSVQDEKNRPTVLDLIKDKTDRIFPVGRLDYCTSGLLLLTNDGELTYGLTHPKHDVDKTYIAKVKGFVTNEQIQKLEQGILIEAYQTAPAKVKCLHRTQQSSKLSITIHEGRNRQVRKMCAAIGHEVLALKRVAIGNITLAHLGVGKYREITKEELIYLKKISDVQVGKKDFNKS